MRVNVDATLVAIFRIIVDFYIDDFIFALFIFMKDGKAVNYNGSKIIGLINLKYGKRTTCRENFFTEMVVFFREAGKRSTTGYKSQPVLDRAPGFPVPSKRGALYYMYRYIDILQYFPRCQISYRDINTRY